jgi:hypothetical protein
MLEETAGIKIEENKLVAMNGEVWLMALRSNLSEVERHIEEAYLHRRELVKLVVGKITVDRAEEGCAKVDIIYRFGSPESPLGADSLVGVRNLSKTYPHQIQNFWFRF